MPIDKIFTYITAAVIVGLIGSQVCRRSFDPFAPVWMFLIGYAQVYVVQPISYREWAIEARGPELVAQANGRALWALLWFLLVYFSGVGKWLARRLPAAPRAWSPGLISVLAPLMMLWGLACAGFFAGSGNREITAEENLLRQFPIFLLLGGVLLIVTGRRPGDPRPALTAMGLAAGLAYLAIWMFNGKRSHSMIAVLATVCAFYVPRLRRPSMPVMAGVGVVCALAVTLAIGWRGTTQYEQSASGFLQYVGDFDPSKVLVNLNVKDREEERPNDGRLASKETEEYGGFLLMMATVPELSPYDYGSPYLRLFSTYIPRIVWPSKPLYGRSEWISAWMAGSQQPREENFTGPAIGILGAAQLNGGVFGTLLVLGVVALVIRTAYDYYRYYADSPWAQAWWAMTYFNAWMMVANDDPSIFIYYMYGHTILAPMAILWLVHKYGGVGDAGGSS